MTPGQESRSGFGQSAAFSQTTIHLAAPPIWISNLRIGSRYLESDTFSGLAKVQFSPDSDFKTWANARVFAIAVLRCNAASCRVSIDRALGE